MNVAAAQLLALPFLALVFLLPFPGTVALRLLLLALGCAVAWRHRRDWRMPVIPFKWALGLWALVCGLSLAYAVDPAYSLGELKNELGYALAAFAAFLAFSRSRGQVEAVAWTVLASSTTMALWGMLRHVRLGRWEDGVGGFASLAVICLPLALLLWPRAGWRVRSVIAVGMTLIVLGVFAAEQRIVWVVWGCQGCLLIVLRQYHHSTRLPLLRVLVVAGSLLALAGTVMLSVHNRKVDESPADYYDLRNDFRLMQWGKITQRIMEHPLTGAGFGREGMKKAYPDLVPSKSPMSLMWHPHNVLLTQGVGMGIPGVLSFLILMLAMLATYGRFIGHDAGEVRSFAAAGILIVSGVMLRNMTNDLFVRDGALLFWSLHGALLGYLLRCERDPG